MDDKTYVKADYSQLPGKQYYVAHTKGGVNAIFKFQKMDKFGKKCMVWQAICSCGLKTSPFITTGTINAQVYIQECLNKRLLPLYKKYEVPHCFGLTWHLHTMQKRPWNGIIRKTFVLCQNMPIHQIVQSFGLSNDTGL